MAKRGRALVAARALVILLPDHDGLRVAHAAGEVPDDLVGQTVAESSVAGRAMDSRRVQRLDDLDRSRFEQQGLGLEAESGLYVPLAFRGRSLGMLVALDRLTGGPQFSSADEQLLTSFATIAAAAVGTAQALSADRQRERAAAAEAERRRWARELHDETLQGIAAVRVMLASSRRADEAELRTTVAQATDELQGEVDRLRDIIHDVRPSSLDDLGLMAAMEALVARHAHDGGPALQLSVDLDHEAGRAPDRLHPDVETAIYRIAQEALANALKHAEAQTVEIAVAEIEGEVGVRVRDDGRGYDAQGKHNRVRPGGHAGAGGAARWPPAHPVDAGRGHHGRGARARASSRAVPSGVRRLSHADNYAGIRATVADDARRHGGQPQCMASSPS